jgi:hypothetical protein
MFVNAFVKKQKTFPKALSKEDIYGVNDIMRSNRHRFTKKMKLPNEMYRK